MLNEEIIKDLYEKIEKLNKEVTGLIYHSSDQDVEIKKLRRENRIIQSQLLHEGSIK